MLAVCAVFLGFAAAPRRAFQLWSFVVPFALLWLSQAERRSGTASLLRGVAFVGFLLSALLLWGTQRVWSPCKKISLLFALMGLVICYGFGTTWFLLVSQQQGSILEIGSVLMTCVVPFILPDCIKLFLAYRVAGRLRPYI